MVTMIWGCSAAPQRTVGAQVNAGSTPVASDATSCASGYGETWSNNFMIAASYSGRTWTVFNIVNATSFVKLFVVPVN